MLDNEFLGGTKVTLQFKHRAGSAVDRETMKRQEVKDRVTAIGKAADPNDQLRKLETAEVLPINPDTDGVTSDQFEIKTVADNSKAVTEAVVAAFTDKLDTKPSVDFLGAEKMQASQAPVYPVEKPVLGANIDDPQARNDVTKYLGGVAIVMKNLSPPQ